MDVITYVDDLEAFRAEAIALIGQTDELNNVLVPQLSLDENGDLIYGVTKIPVLYEGLESLTLIRIGSDDQLQYFNHMLRLGECVNGAYVFDDEAAQATYERVRGDLIVTYIDENGDEQTFNKPYMIGVFA